MAVKHSQSSFFFFLKTLAIWEQISGLSFFFHKEAKVYIPLQLRNWPGEAAVAAIYNGQEKNVLLSATGSSSHHGMFQKDWLHPAKCIVA